MLRSCVLFLILSHYYRLVEVKDRIKPEPQTVGCFVFNNESIYLPFEITDPFAANSVDNCTEACSISYFRYAGLRNAEKCACGSSLKDHGQSEKDYCNKRCPGNSSLPCGGVTATSVYDTGQRLPGPPGSLKLLSASKEGLEISWIPPVATNGEITSYSVMAKPIHTFALNSYVPPVMLTYQNLITRVGLVGLHPGTEYSVAVSAINSAGEGAPSKINARTQISEPTAPDIPEVIDRNNGRLKIRIHKPINENGPVTSYKIVVIDGRSIIFDQKNLKSFEEAQADGLLYYVAAEIKAEDFNEEFTVGDNRTYGGYYNPPLPEGTDVHVTLGLVSSLNGTTFETYANVTHDQHNNGAFVISVEQDSGSDMVVGLSAAVGVFGILLLLSVVGYAVLRRRLGRRRSALDHQELSLQGPIVEVENNIYVHNGFVPEEEEEAYPNHYEKLKHQVWNIPRNFLEVTSDKLGHGTYGSVVKGTVQQRGFPVHVAIQAINDVALDGGCRKNMLKDLDVLIRVGTNTNVLNLVGVCEAPDILYIVMEYHPATLKDILLESRWLQHSDKSQSKVCSLPEHHVLEICIGIACGMDHLHSKKILHKQLCARNILMADGVIPKVTDFGISQYKKEGYALDFTRWMAQEIFRSRHFVSKSDVWSFGVTLWEITAFGGTPYSEIENKEVAGRVMHGLRLGQLSTVGDDLYQLMLQCWQLDLDERPTFAEIICILRNILTDAVNQLNFTSSAGFRYEAYLPELEMCM